MRAITVTAGPAVPGGPATVLLSWPENVQVPTLDGPYVSGGIAVFPNPCRVVIFSLNDNSNILFQITGFKTVAGELVIEQLYGPKANDYAFTVNKFQRVTKVEIFTASVNGFVTVGNEANNYSPLVAFDPYAMPQISIQCVPTGTVTYTVQQTLEDPNSPTDPARADALNFVNHPDDALVNATEIVQGNYGYVPAYARVVVISGDGSVTATFIQSGNVTK